MRIHTILRHLEPTYILCNLISLCMIMLQLDPLIILEMCFSLWLSFMCVCSYIFLVVDCGFVKLRAYNASSGLGNRYRFLCFLLLCSFCCGIVCQFIALVWVENWFNQCLVTFRLVFLRWLLVTSFESLCKCYLGCFLQSSSATHKNNQMICFWHHVSSSYEEFYCPLPQ